MRHRFHQTVASSTHPYRRKPNQTRKFSSSLFAVAVAAAGAGILSTLDFGILGGNGDAVAYGDGHADFLGQRDMANGLIRRRLANHDRCALAGGGDAAEGSRRG